MAKTAGKGKTVLSQPEKVHLLGHSPPHRPVPCSATYAGSRQQGKGRGGQESHGTPADRALTRASTRAATGPRCLPWPATAAPAPSRGRSRSPVQNPGFLGKGKRTLWRRSIPGTTQQSQPPRLRQRAHWEFLIPQRSCSELPTRPCVSEHVLPGC